MDNKARPAFLGNFRGALGFIGLGSSYVPQKVYAQANAYIKVVANKSYAQTNAYIKAIAVKGYAQSQADIKAIYRQNAQAQAYIKLIRPQFSQAAGAISGTIPLTDTFTRTIALNSGWGTSDSGHVWTDETGTGSGVTGSEGQINLPSGIARTIAAYRSMTRGTTGGSAVFKFDQIPASGTADFLIYSYRTASVTGSINVAGVRLYPTADLAMVAGAGINSAQIIGNGDSYVAGDYWNIKYRLVLTTYGTTTYAYVKIWKVGTTEPGWTQFTLTTDTTTYPKPLIGHVAILGQGATSPTINLYVDNLSVYQDAPQQSAQALAEVKTTYRQYGQAQAWVLKRTGFAQANADIKTSYTSVAQANAYIILKPLKYAQSSASIRTSITTIVDTFTRTVADGWGTADTGGDWYRDIGDTGFFSVPAGIYQSKLTLPNIDGAHGIYLLSTYITGIYEGYLWVGWEGSPPYDGRTSIYIVPYYQPVTNTGMGVSLEIDEAGNKIVASVYVDNTLYQKANASRTFAATGTWIKFRIVPTKYGSVGFYLKVWDAEGQEPGWQDYSEYTTASSSLGGGSFQLFAMRLTGTNGRNLYFDNINVYPAAQTQSAQAIADIKATTRQYGQAQAWILKRTGFAQAAGAVNGQYTSVYDTFTRDVVNSWGTSDNAGDWTLSVGTASEIKVLSDLGGIVTQFAGYSTKALRLNSLLTYGTTEGVFKWTRRGAADPITDVDDIELKFYGQASLGLTDYSGFGAGVKLDESTSQLTIWFYNGGFGSASPVSIGWYGQADYWFKVRVVPTQFGNWGIYTKLWNDALPEPGWMDYTELTPISAVPFGAPLLYLISNSTSGGRELRVDNFQVYHAAQTQSAQALAKIKAIGVTSYAQAQADLKQEYKVYAQTAAKIFLVQQQCAQVQGWIRVLGAQVYAQTQADIRQEYRSYAQAGAYIKLVQQGYAQAQAMLPSTYRVAQARARIKQSYEPVGQAAADVKRAVRRLAQSRAVILRTYNYHGAAAAMISHYAQGRAQASAHIIRHPMAHSQAKVKIAGTLVVTQWAQAMADVHVLEYIVQYNGQRLPGYAQSEATQGDVVVVEHPSLYNDMQTAEYGGSVNKTIAITMRIMGSTLEAMLESYREAGTILFGNKGMLVRIYIGRRDRYYIGMAKSLKADIGAKDRWLDYQVEFSVQPFLYSNDTRTVSVGSTGATVLATRYISNGVRTPATIRVTGTDVTISGYISGSFVGYISVSGYVEDMEIGTDPFSTTIGGQNADGYLRNPDAGLYLDTGINTIDVQSTDTPAITVTWKDRWGL